MKDNKIIAALNTYEDFPRISIDRKRNKMSIALDGYSFICVSQNIWSDVLNIFLSKQAIHKKITYISINTPGYIMFNYSFEGERKPWLTAVECMGILKEYVTFDGFVDIHKLVNPLSTLYYDGSEQEQENLVVYLESISEMDAFYNRLCYI